MTEFEDKVDHQMFDIRFKATNAEANELWIEIISSPEWLEYDALDDTMRWGLWTMHKQNLIGQPLTVVTNRHAKLRQVLTRKVWELVRQRFQ